MNFIPDLQFIIIVSLIAAAVFTAVAMIFYRLGKREKERIINENKKIFIEKNESSSTAIQPQQTQSSSNEINQGVIIENKSEMNEHLKEKKVSFTELYSQKIEEEINNADKNNSEENDITFDFKFLKYTSNGYKPAKGDKDSRVLRWK